MIDEPTRTIENKEWDKSGRDGTLSGKTQSRPQLSSYKNAQR